MTLRHLKIFLEVADTGKMSTAAKNLYITQPSVSQTIHELEDHFHVLLFERLCKKLYITEAGKHLYQYAKRVVSQYEQLEMRMADASLPEILRMGATISVGGSILSDIMELFEKRNPHTNLYVRVTNTRDVEQKLLHMELDAGLVEGSITHPDLISLPMIDDLLVLVCSAKHPFATKKTLFTQELANERFAVREPGSGTRELFEQYLEQYHIPIQTALEGNTPDTLKKAVIYNHCLSVLSVRLIEKEFKQGLVQIFTPLEHNWKRCFSFVYHKDKFLSPSLIDLKNLIQSYGENEHLSELQAGRLVASKKEVSYYADYFPTFGENL